MPKTISSQELTPGILSLLPMIYIGWSDSVLSPTEMQMIHSRVKSVDYLSQEEKDYLISLMDPLNPPSAATFKQWTDALTLHASTLKSEDKQSLVDIGIQIASAAVGKSAGEPWIAPKARKALEEIQEALGLDHQESTDLLLSTIDTSEPLHSDSPSFDPVAMQSILDGETANTKNRLRKLLRDPFFGYQIVRNKEAYRDLILEQVKALGEQGLGAYAFPKKYGGLERIGEHITVFEMLAYSDLSRLIKFGVQFGLFGGAVYGLGTDRHHRKYLEPLGKAELLGCFAMTETGHGSNVKGLETTATYDHNTGMITIHSPSYSAGKEYIGNSMHSTMAAVFAQLIVNGEQHGVHCILVPIRNAAHEVLPGIRIEDCGYKMGLNGVDNGRIWFDQVQVPKENLLNKYGDIDDSGQYISPIKNPNKRFFTMLGALVAGRICIGLAAANASKSALTIAVRYALKRRQFGPDHAPEEMPIMDYPTHQLRLLPRLAKTYGLYFALSDLANDYVGADEAGMRKIETKAAGLKALASWHATDTIQECREACGGKGYLSENRFADLKADTDIFTTFEGDNTVLMQLVAKGLLTEFKQSFHDEGFMAVIRYLTTRMGNTAAEYNPIYRRNTSIEHLMDPDFHHHAFRYREKKILLSLSQRMQSYLKKRLKPYDAFLKCQQHMMALAHAYVDRLVMKAFGRKIEALEPSPERIMIEQLSALYAISTIDEHKGWYLEADYMDGSKTKAIRRLIQKLCSEIKPEAKALVDAFGIPEELLGAEIIQ